MASRCPVDAAAVDMHRDIVAALLPDMRQGRQTNLHIAKARQKVHAVFAIDDESARATREEPHARGCRFTAADALIVLC